MPLSSLNVLDDATLAIYQYVYNMLYFFLEPIKSLQILQLEQELQTNEAMNVSEKREFPGSIESWANKVVHDFDEPFTTMVNNQNMIGHRERALNGRKMIMEANGKTTISLEIRQR